jgi:hypothetical protein
MGEVRIVEDAFVVHRGGVPSHSPPWLELDRAFLLENESWSRSCSAIVAAIQFLEQMVVSYSREPGAGAESQYQDWRAGASKWAAPRLEGQLKRKEHRGGRRVMVAGRSGGKSDEDVRTVSNRKNAYWAWGGRSRAHQCYASIFVNAGVWRAS